MSASALMFTYGCCQKISRPTVNPLTAQLNSGAKIYLALATIDTCVALTSLVLGILGSLAIIPMPAIAAYSLIALSGAILLAWIGATIFSKGANFEYISEIVPALCKKPQIN